LRGVESLADDLDAGPGHVISRVALLLRANECKPAAPGLAYAFHRSDAMGGSAEEGARRVHHVIHSRRCGGCDPLWLGKGALGGLRHLKCLGRIRPCAQRSNTGETSPRLVSIAYRLAPRLCHFAMMHLSHLCGTSQPWGCDRLGSLHIANTPGGIAFISNSAPAAPNIPGGRSKDHRPNQTSRHLRAGG
jgi:hypothetical protein